MSNDLTNEMLKSIDKNFELLVTNEVGVLPERIFISNFLPFFCGERKIENTTVINDWISIAGSPSKEVSIQNDNGQELFRVPAIMDTNTIDAVGKGKGNSISEIFINYELQKGILPIIGINYLKKAMDEKVTNIIKTSDSFESNSNRWLKIFERYSKTSIVKTAQAEAIKNNQDDDLDYE